MPTHNLIRVPKNLKSAGQIVNEMPIQPNMGPLRYPGRTELGALLWLFQQGIKQSGLFLDPESLEVLTASIEETLKTMHELPTAG